MHPVRNLIHDIDPYEGFDWQARHATPGEWGGNDPLFGKLLAEYRPKLVIEVGSWKGDSAISMAKAADHLDLDTHILCIDTWLGNLPAWTTKRKDRQFYGDLKLHHGYPSVYYDFLANVCQAGVQDHITPFPAISKSAAVALRQWQVKAELIYIDASHEREDVAEDVDNYFRRLSIGGHLFGHDYQMPAVRLAVQSFAEKNKLEILQEGQFWRLLQ